MCEIVILKEWRRRDGVNRATFAKFHRKELHGLPAVPGTKFETIGEIAKRIIPRR